MNTEGLLLPKPKPAKRSHPDAALDKRESAKVRKRSEGQCEVTEARAPWDGVFAAVRCHRAATEVMHLIGGNGKRGRGRSALAIHKLHACRQCHDDIDGDLGGRRLVRIGGTVPMFTDPYRRVR